MRCSDGAGTHRVGTGHVVADQHHVASGGRRRLGPRDHVARAMCADHFEIVREDRAVEPEPAAQDFVQPFPRVAGGERVDCRIDDVRRHHPLEAPPDQRSERHEVLGRDRREAALVLRQRIVRIRGDVAMSREMLAHRRHAFGVQSVDKGSREMRRGVGVAMECAVADDAAGAVIEIEHRRKREVHAMGAQLARDGRSDPTGLGGGGGDVAVPRLAQRAHRRNRRKPFAEALHASALVVHTDQEPRFAQRANRRRQRAELRRRREIAREQDDAAGRWMREARAIGGREFQAFDAEHHGAEGDRRHNPSCRPAASRSSDFICRTASRSPTKTERETIACPMWSSRMPSNAATGCTLK